MIKSLLLLLSLLTAESGATAQSKILGDYVVNDPQTWAFVRYGGQIPDLYTGTVRVTIPVYTYRDPDFEIPISLVYASNGYQPNVQANYVGLGWSLDAGGCITRRVNGIRDEEELSYQAGGMAGARISGHYLYSLTSHGSVPILDRPYCGVQAVGANLGTEYCLLAGGSNYETRPDVFSFNFTGHSGRFVIDEDGSVSVFDSNIPAGELTVDLSRLGLTLFRSAITIRTGDGYQYEFGGLLTEGEADILDTADMTTADGPRYIYRGDIWHLRRITAPNGRHVDFTYGIASMSTISPRGAREARSIMAVTAGNPGESVHDGSVHWDEHFLQYTSNVAQITGISVDGMCEIRFTYAERTPETGVYGTAHRTLATPRRLAGIRVVDTGSGSGRTLLDCTLEHRYGQGNPVMMLASVRLSGTGEYRMDYHGQDGIFPDQGCVKIDHWGFYNANPSGLVSSLLPSVSTTDDYTENIITQSREPDFARTMTGMLERIVYPTGGWTSYGYDMRRYSRKVIRSEHSHGIPALEECAEGDGGGLRVTSVTDCTPDGTASGRSYVYGPGNMLLYPRYSNRVVTHANGSALYVDNVSTAQTNGYMMDGTYIEYGTVVERFADGSSTVHRFRNYEDTPDLTDVDYGEDDWQGADFSCADFDMPSPLTAHNYFREFPSRSLLRGKPSGTEHRSPSGVLLKTETYTYEDGNSRYSPYASVTAGSRYEGQYLIPYCDLTGVTTTLYDSEGNEAVTTVSNTYNGRRQLRTRRVTDMDRTFRRTHFYYPQEATGALAGTVEAQMAAAGRISGPVCVVETCGSGTSEAIVSAVRTRYRIAASGGLTMYVRESRNTVMTPAAVPTQISWAAARSIVGALPARTDVTWGAYSSLGRPCEVTDADGIKSSIVWGYGGLYPVAIAENCSAASLSTAGINAAADAGWSGLSASQEAALRAVRGASVTTWKHLPFVGVTEKTGPDGRRTTYTYDDAGRLSSVTGPDGMRTTGYNYNIISE